MSTRGSKRTSTRRNTSSSQKSSSTLQSTPLSDDKKVSNNFRTFFLIGSVINILYYLLIIRYIIKLEDKLCDCVKDWRHDFIKYYSIGMIIWVIIMVVVGNITFMMNNMRMMKYIMLVLFGIYVWCLFTYIGDLNRTKCACAIEKQANLHAFLNVWRYILVGLFVVNIAFFVFISTKS